MLNKIISQLSLPILSIPTAGLKSLQKRGANDVSFDSLATAQRPGLTAKATKILNKIVTSYITQDLTLLPKHQMETVAENIEIIKGNPLSIIIVDSHNPNAFVYKHRGRICITTGLFRRILETMPKSAQNWDLIATIIGHEIGHILYDTRGDFNAIEIKDVRARHDMENQCDRDGLSLADTAGYNVNFARFDWVPDCNIKEPNLGLKSSHPNPHSRHQYIRRVVFGGYWRNYQETSTRPFTTEEIMEINQASPLEQAFNRIIGVKGNVDTMESRFLELISQLQKYRELLPAQVSDEKHFASYWMLKAKKEDMLPLTDSVESTSALQAIQRYKTGALLGLHEQIEQLIAVMPLLNSSRAIMSDIVQLLLTGNDVIIQHSLQDVLAFLEEIPTFEQLNTKHVSTDVPAYFEQITKEIKAATFYAIMQMSAPHNYMDNAAYLQIQELMLFNFGEEFVKTSIDDGVIKIAKPTQRLYPTTPINDVIISKIRSAIESGDNIFAKHLIGNMDEQGQIALIHDDLVFRFMAQTQLADFAFLTRNQEHLTIEQYIWLCSDPITLKSIDNRHSFEPPTLALCRKVYRSTLTLKDAENIVLAVPKILKAIDTYYPRVGQNFAHQHLATAFHRAFWTINDEVTPRNTTEAFVYYPKSSYKKDARDSTGYNFIDIIMSWNKDQVLQLMRQANVQHGDGRKTIEALSQAFQVKYHLPTFPQYDHRITVSSSGSLRHYGGTSFLAHAVSKTHPTGLLPTMAFDKYADQDKVSDIPSNLYQNHEVTDEDAQILLGHTHTNTTPIHIQAYIEQAMVNDTWSNERLGEVASWVSDQDNFIFDPSRSDTPIPLSENLGPQISARDYVYLLHFQSNNLEKFNQLAQQQPDAVISWINEFWPKASPYRDVILTQLFRDSFADIADSSTQWKLCELFHEPKRSIIFRNQYYQQIKQTNSYKQSSFQDRIDLLLKVFPRPTADRDYLLNQLLKEQPFHFHDYERIALLFADESRKTQREESILEGTIGAKITEWTAAEKRQVLAWLAHGQETPEVIQHYESLGVSLDEIKLMFQQSPGTRHQLLRALFIENGGLLAPDNIAERDGWIKTLFSQLDTSDNPQLAAFGKEAFTEILAVSNLNKNLRIITSIYDAKAKLDSKDQALSVEEFLAYLLTQYGAGGVKLGQILASQPKVQAQFPALYKRLEALKDDANPMSFQEAMLIISHHPVLRDKKIEIIKRVGSASMKGVFLVRIDGEENIMKLRRLTAEKDLEKEESSFNELMNRLKPILQNHFGVEHIPNYSQRIFSSIREEVDFQREIKNTVKLKELVTTQSKGNVTFNVPVVDESLSSDRIIIEDIAPGVPLDQFEVEHSEESKLLSTLHSALRESLSAQLFDHGYFHADPHSRNIFVHEDSGKLVITYIDVGLVGHANDSVELPMLNQVKDSLFQNTSKGYIALFSLLLPPDIYEENVGYIAESVATLLDKTPLQRSLLILSILDNISYYEIPDILFRAVVAISKANYLFAIDSSDKMKYIWQYLIKLLTGWWK